MCAGGFQQKKTTTQQTGTADAIQSLQHTEASWQEKHSCMVVVPCENLFVIIFHSETWYNKDITIILCLYWRKK